MKFKDYPSSLLNHLRGGFLRFAPFIIFVVICAASLIWNNNVPSHETAAHRIPVSFAAGACWGALSALAVRLAVERRACRAALTHALPSITSMIMAVIGAWFWYHMYETDAGYDFWEMLYFGSCVSIGAFAAAQLFGKRNAWTVFGRIFIAAVFAGLVLTVSPFNILDVPIMQQSARLRSALERSGCFVGGSLSVPEKPDIAEKEAKVIDGAWRYLTGCGRTFFGYTRGRGTAYSLHLRQGVWNRNTFARDIADTARKLSGQNPPNLPKMLKINSAKFDERRHVLPDSKTLNHFTLDHESGAVDIAGYTKFETVAPFFGYEDGKYFVTLPQGAPTKRIDVTAHVKKLLGNSGAAADTADGNFHSYTLRAEDAVWKLAPDLAFVVTRLTLYHPPEKQREVHLYGYILRK